MATEPSAESSPAAEQSLADRGQNRSQRPTSSAFLDWVTSGWAERPASTAVPGDAAPFTAARRARLAAQFPGERLVVPAGAFRYARTTPATGYPRTTP